jgi:hypothetical protein
MRVQPQRWQHLHTPSVLSASDNQCPVSDRFVQTDIHRCHLGSVHARGISRESRLQRGWASAALATVASQPSRNPSGSASAHVCGCDSIDRRYHTRITYMLRGPRRVRGKNAYKWYPRPRGAAPRYIYACRPDTTRASHAPGSRTPAPAAAARGSGGRSFVDTAQQAVQGFVFLADQGGMGEGVIVAPPRRRRCAYAGGSTCLIAASVVLCGCILPAVSAQQEDGSASSCEATLMCEASVYPCRSFRFVGARLTVAALLLRVLILPPASRPAQSHYRAAQCDLLQRSR